MCSKLHQTTKSHRPGPPLLGVVIAQKRGEGQGRARDVVARLIIPTFSKSSELTWFSIQLLSKN